MKDINLDLLLQEELEKILSENECHIKLEHFDGDIEAFRQALNKATPNIKWHSNE